MSLLAMLSPLLLATAAPAAQQCNPIPGWDQVLADEKVTTIVLGEYHGTNEMPALFADAVCLTAQTRPVVVGLEFDTRDQPAIDTFLASDGGAEAKRAFLGAAMWGYPMKDGRSSEAMFRLFETLRAMRAEGRIQGVVAFRQLVVSRTGEPDPEAFERAMAEMIVGGRPAGATVVALVGNAHAMLTPVPWGTRYIAMAGHLPREEVLTLNVTSLGGSSWNCQGSPPVCEARPGLAAPDGPQRGVVLGAGGEAFSGVLNLGTPTTASPPQTSDDRS